MIDGVHTPARAAGVVFDMVRPQMAAMWHCNVIDGLIEPIFEDMRKAHSGAATLRQDLTVFNVTAGAVTARRLVARRPHPLRSARQRCASSLLQTG